MSKNGLFCRPYLGSFSVRESYAKKNQWEKCRLTSDKFRFFRSKKSVFFGTLLYMFYLQLWSDNHRFHYKSRIRWSVQEFGLSDKILNDIWTVIFNLAKKTFLELHQISHILRTDQGCYFKWPIRGPQLYSRKLLFQKRIFIEKKNLKKAPSPIEIISNHDVTLTRLNEKVTPICTSVKITRDEDEFIGIGRNLYFAAVQAAQEMIF